MLYLHNMVRINKLTLFSRPMVIMFKWMSHELLPERSLSKTGVL